MLLGSLSFHFNKFNGSQFECLWNMILSDLFISSFTFAIAVKRLFQWYVCVSLNILVDQFLFSFFIFFILLKHVFGLLFNSTPTVGSYTDKAFCFGYSKIVNMLFLHSFARTNDCQKWRHWKLTILRGNVFYQFIVHARVNV